MNQKKEYWKDIKYRGQSDDAFARGTHKTKEQIFGKENPIERALEKKHNIQLSHQEDHPSNWHKPEDWKKVKKGTEWAGIYHAKQPAPVSPRAMWGEHQRLKKLEKNK